MRQVTITINVESIIVERDGSFAIDKYSSEANDIVFYDSIKDKLVEEALLNKKIKFIQDYEKNFFLGFEYPGQSFIYTKEDTNERIEVLIELQTMRNDIQEYEGESFRTIATEEN